MKPLLTILILAGFVLAGCAGIKTVNIAGDVHFRAIDLGFDPIKLKKEKKLLIKIDQRYEESFERLDELVLEVEKAEKSGKLFNPKRDIVDTPWFVHRIWVNDKKGERVPVLVFTDAKKEIWKYDISYLRKNSKTVFVDIDAVYLPKNKMYVSRKLNEVKLIDGKLSSSK